MRLSASAQISWFLVKASNVRYSRKTNGVRSCTYSDVSSTFPSLRLTVRDPVSACDGSQYDWSVLGMHRINYPAG